MEVLKINIYQPQAHYRMPFTYQRRHTYPIPPYSTILGFLCNILGIKNYNGNGGPNEEKFDKLKKTKIAICGKFEIKTTEYTWFRNLEKDSHIKRFGTAENRFVNGHIEHIGGQTPVLIDVLNNVNIVIYLYHNDKEFLNNIEDSLKNPKDRLYPLHLGRSEDWIVFKDIEKLDLVEEDTGGNFRYFFWIPQKPYPANPTNFVKIGGLRYKITTFYKIQNGTRNFEFIEVKLNEGSISGINFFWDKKGNLPVFFANFEDREV